LYESLYDALNQVPEIPYIFKSWSFSKLLYCVVIKVFVILNVQIATFLT
jgi:hypothetical protein